MGGLGLQKVSPRSELKMLVSMMAPAGPTAGGWLLQSWTKVVVRARGLQCNTVSGPCKFWRCTAYFSHLYYRTTI